MNKPMNTIKIFLIIMTLFLVGWLKHEPRETEVANKSTVKLAKLQTVKKVAKKEEITRQLPAGEGAPRLSPDDQEFITALLLRVEEVESTILASRKKLKKLYYQWRAKRKLKPIQIAWLTKLAQNYRVSDANFNTAKTWQLLLKRVDIVPVSMVLAQSINESNWGRSRFARDANNYFGRWCYKQGCGLVPLRRPKGETYEVKKYNTVLASVKDYMHGLNVFGAYRSFRTIRHKLRKQDKPLNSILLARGLSRYSQRGEAYVVSIQDIIRRYDLRRYDNNNF